MESSVLAVDLLTPLQVTSQPSAAPNSESDIEGNDFPAYFNEAMERNIGGEAGISMKDNLAGKNSGDDNYIEDSAEQDLNPELLPITADGTDFKTDITEMGAAFFLSLIGFNIEDINTVLQQTNGEISPSPDSRGDIKAVDFLKDLGFSEDSAENIVAQAYFFGLGINLDAAGEADSGNNPLSISESPQNGTKLLGDLKQITTAESLQKTFSPLEEISSEPVSEPLQKNILIDPLRSLKALEEIKDIISNKIENTRLTVESGFNVEQIDSLYSPQDSKAEVKTINLSDKSNKIEAPIMTSLSIGEGKEQKSAVGEVSSIDSNLQSSDKFSLGAKESVVLRGVDFTDKAGTGDIQQSQKTVLDKTVINQIVERAAVFIRGEKNEIKIHLEPPSLGSIHMKVTAESNNIRATMVTDTPAVKEVIESNLGELKRSLSDAGIKVDQFSVFVGNGYNYRDGGRDLMPHREKADISESETVNIADKKMGVRWDINSQNIINIFI